MELSGTVMGGGALKLEATHIRRLPFPELSKEQAKKLSALGEKLAIGANDETTFQKINAIVIEALVGSSQLQQRQSELEEISSAQLNMRTRRK